MGNARSTRTSPTLLGRLGTNPADQAAWSGFVARYGPRIYAWCRQWHLQDADAEDVTQSVLVKLAEKMRVFHYDPARSFRGWLKTLTRHAVSDFMRSRPREGAGGDAADQLNSLAARDDLVRRLEEEFDRELLDEAMTRVRVRVAPAKWEVFRLLAVDGLSGAEVAERVAMKVVTVFAIRSKVQKLLHDEIRILERGDEAAAEGSDDAMPQQ